MTAGLIFIAAMVAADLLALALVSINPRGRDGDE